MWHSDAARADTQEYKVDRKRKAPPGWQYLEDSDGETPSSPPATKKMKQSNNTRFKPESPSTIKYDMIVWARVPGFPPHPAMVRFYFEACVYTHIHHELPRLSIHLP